MELTNLSEKKGIFKIFLLLTKFIFLLILFLIAFDIFE